MRIDISVPAVAAGLIGGYGVSDLTGRRELGGAVLLAAGAVAARSWWRRGPLVTGVLTATYVGAFGAAHPLAKKLGAWPSVLAVTAGATAVTAGVTAAL